MHKRAVRTWAMCRHTRVSEPYLQWMTSNSVLSLTWLNQTQLEPPEIYPLGQRVYINFF